MKMTKEQVKETIKDLTNEWMIGRTESAESFKMSEDDYCEKMDFLETRICELNAFLYHNIEVWDGCIDVENN